MWIHHEDFVCNNASHWQHIFFTEKAAIELGPVLPRLCLNSEELIRRRISIG
jgi:hypothetical protein